jgi:8-oxo-dGTP pyrophosphatase MutT (NUDIX family)
LPEVLIVERPARGAFGGLHVFPGDEVDTIDDAFSRDRSDRAASDILGVERGGLSYWVAAIRESFEEAGVLLGYDGDDLVDLSDASRRARFELRALIEGRLTLGELCGLEHLELAIERIHYFSHRITPLGAPARFDTRFFLAVMPPNQHVSLRANELEGGRWITPQAALERHRQGIWRMIHPTLTTLETLAGYADVDRLLADALSWRHLPEVTEERARQGMQRPLR